MLQGNHLSHSSSLHFNFFKTPSFLSPCLCKSSTEMAPLKLATLALFLISLPLIHATDTSYCDKKAKYDVKVSGVEISPNPVVRGQPATFSISATTGEVISTGKMVIEVSYFGWHIHSESHDLCERTTCPVSGDFVISHSQILPGFTPPGSYSLKMKMYDGSNQELTCIAFDFSIGFATSVLGSWVA